MLETRYTQMFSTSILAVNEFKSFCAVSALLLKSPCQQFSSQTTLMFSQISQVSCTFILILTLITLNYAVQVNLPRLGYVKAIDVYFLGENFFMFCGSFGGSEFGYQAEVVREERCHLDGNVTFRMSGFHLSGSR